MSKTVITGFPLYHPLQIHKDPMALACAMIKDEQQAQQEKYICSRHLDNVIQDVDEQHMQQVKRDIEAGGYYLYRILEGTLSHHVFVKKWTSRIKV